MDAFSSAFDTGKEGGVSAPVQLKNWIWCAEVRFAYSPWNSRSGGCWPGIRLVAHENETSVPTVICLGLGSSGSIACSALGIDNYHFCGSRDFLGNHSCFILHLFRCKIKGKQTFCVCVVVVFFNLVSFMAPM